jgi:hypothetical protein
MPKEMIKKFADKVGKSEEEVEKLYSQAKSLVKKEYPDVKEGDDKYYALVVGILKKSLGKELEESVVEEANEYKSQSDIVIPFVKDTKDGVKYLTFNDYMQLPHAGKFKPAIFALLSKITRKYQKDGIDVEVGLERNNDWTNTKDGMFMVVKVIGDHDEKLLKSITKDIKTNFKTDKAFSKVDKNDLFLVADRYNDGSEKARFWSKGGAKDLFQVYTQDHTGKLIKESIEEIEMIEEALTVIKDKINFKTDTKELNKSIDLLKDIVDSKNDGLVLNMKMKKDDKKGDYGLVFVKPSHKYKVGDIVQQEDGTYAKIEAVVSKDDVIKESTAPKTLREHFISKGLMEEEKEVDIEEAKKKENYEALLTQYEKNQKDMLSTFIGSHQEKKSKEILASRKKYKKINSELVKKLEKFSQWDTLEEGKDDAKPGDKKEYQAFFNKKLKKYGVDSPEDLADEDKKKFWDEVDSEWKSENETD